MKLSVSLPDEDVAYLDSYAASNDVGSRSAVLRRALAVLRSADLEAAYEDAFAEWSGSEDAALWEATAGDGRGTP